MAALAFRADIKLATATLDAIDAAMLKAADDGLRQHLGASLIGKLHRDGAALANAMAFTRSLLAP